MKFSFRAKIFLIIITIFFIRAANAGTAFAATQLTDIHSDTTLDPSITYEVNAVSITVFPGATLTIPAGTHLLFTPGSRLNVEGNIIAKGTSENHIVITGGVDQPFIPLALPALTIPTITPENTDSVQTPETTPIEIDQTSDVGSMVFSDSIMTESAAVTIQKHEGIKLGSGATATLSYIDMSDADHGITLADGAKVKIDHVNFSESNTAIWGSGVDTIALTNSNFENVITPVEFDFHGTFTHSNNTFSNDGIKGWEYVGGFQAGDTMKLNSTDGEYFLSDETVEAKSSLVISPGVTIFAKDAEAAQIFGTLTAEGTASQPIIVYGDGTCSTHTPIFSFNQAENISMKYVQFRNLCSGITGMQSKTVLLSHLDFNTIAGAALTFTDGSDVTADYITMQDVYQVARILSASRFKTSNDNFTTINANAPAVDIQGQSPVSIKESQISNADTCIEVSTNSSLNADKLQLSMCQKFGIYSYNDSGSGPSGLTLTNSEIGYSGGAMNLTDAVVTNVSNDNFHDDGAGMVLKHMPKTVLINNAWGSSTGPTIDSNPQGVGTRISTTDVIEVDYRPWIGMVTVDHNPIIIVPGITGSVLSKTYGDKTELWPNIPKLTLSPTDSFLNDLELNQDGTTNSARPVDVGDIIRSAGQADVFDGLIGSLLQNGYKEGVDLFVLPYDWRLSNTKNQSLLKDAISNALTKSGKTKVNIIAHSMGGLLVKDYLVQNPATPVDHLFFIAVPHLGAPKAFKALMYGDDMGYNFTVASAISVHVLNPDRIKTISQNMPAVYELLPSDKYIQTIGSYVEDLTKPVASLTNQDVKTFMESDGRNSAMFPFTKTLHDATDTMEFSSVPTYNFAGCGLTKTVGKIVLTKKETFTVTGLQLSDEHRLVYAQGDGTVPLDSATAAEGAKNYYVAYGSHGTLPSTQPVEDAINDVLNGAAIENSLSISSAPTDCNLTGEVVEIHSPVTLDIYDAQGRHTGPTSGGDVEFGIPNVDYEMIGDEKFAFLPSGQTYKIISHAEAAGTYDMYISHTDGDDAITHESYFSDVPIDATSVGTVTVTPGQNDYEINLDQDGTGTTDTVVTPSSSLNATQVKDITAPVTTATFTNGMVILTATDDNAGVLNTKYSTDNIHWNLYAEPFASGSGNTVYFLSMDKAGNVETIQHVTVPSDTDTNDNTSNTSTTDSDMPQNTNNDNPSITIPVTITETSPNQPSDVQTPEVGPQETTVPNQTSNVQSQEVTPPTISKDDVTDSIPYKAVLALQNVNNLPIISMSDENITPQSLLASTFGLSKNVAITILVTIFIIIVVLLSKHLFGKNDNEDNQ